MAQEDNTQQNAPEQAAGGPDVQDATPAPASPSAAPEDRRELLNTARAFLTSPQVIHEDVSAKRGFLAQKGLNEVEIEGLIRELVSIRCNDSSMIQLLIHHVFSHR